MLRRSILHASQAVGSLWPGIENTEAHSESGLLYFVRPGRIELPSHPWQGRVLPLNHDRRLLLLQYSRRGRCRPLYIRYRSRRWSRKTRRGRRLVPGRKTLRSNIRQNNQQGNEKEKNTNKIKYDFLLHGFNVLGVGLGPTRPCDQGILSPSRIPFRHPSETLRPRGESNSRIRVLQTLALPLGY